MAGGGGFPGLIVFPRINIINVIQQSVLDEGAITLGRILSHFLNRSRHRSAAVADPRSTSGSIAELLE